MEAWFLRDTTEELTLCVCYMKEFEMPPMEDTELGVLSRLLLFPGVEIFLKGLLSALVLFNCSSEANVGLNELVVALTGGLLIPLPIIVVVVALKEGGNMPLPIPGFSLSCLFNQEII